MSKPDYALIPVEKDKVHPARINGARMVQVTSPTTETYPLPDGGTVTIETTDEGLEAYFLGARKSLFDAGVIDLDNIVNLHGGGSRQFLMKAAVIDTTLSSIDAVLDLIRNHHWDSIHNIARSVLDAYLVYDGLFYASDPDQYIENIFSGKKVDNLKSVSGHQLSYTHIAELSSQKNEHIIHLFRKYSSEHHFGSEAITRLAWNGGNPDDDSDIMLLGLGASSRPLDQRSLETCLGFMHLLEYSGDLGMKLSSDQVDAAQAIADIRNPNGRKKPKNVATSLAAPKTI